MKALAALILLACSPGIAALDLAPYVFARTDTGVVCDHKLDQCEPTSGAKAGVGVELRGRVRVKFGYTYKQDLYPDRPAGDHFVGTSWSWGKELDR